MAQVHGKAGFGVRKMGWGYFKRNTSKLLVVYGLAILICWMASQMLQFNGYIAIVLALTGILAFGFFFVLLRSNEISRDIDNAVQGALAEEGVSELLSQLPKYFSIYHDIVVDKWNIDHIVVGKTGVFVIETKSYKGYIRLNNEFTKKNVLQAKRNAVWLQKILQEVVQTKIFVTPILLYPNVKSLNTIVDHATLVSSKFLNNTITERAQTLTVQDMEVVKERIQRLRNDYKM